VTDHKLFSILPYKDQLIKLDTPLSAKAYYRHYVIDLLSGKKESYDFLKWIKDLEKIKMSSFEDVPRVIHLFYELGFLIEKEDGFFKDDQLLAVDIIFSHYQAVSPINFKKIKLDIVSGPDFSIYRQAYHQGYKELIKGNCYQFNLTCPFNYSFDKKYGAIDFIFSLWENNKTRGAFGSATYIPLWDKLFLSNSPECLFQYNNNILSSLPIKGTMPLQNAKNWRHVWKNLICDKKSQAELYMISDLIRNDLSRIELPRAIIVKNKAPKIVPGLLHQYSQIEIELSDNVNVWRVIEKMFPGGSITGAPKLRAMRLIDQLEKRERSFYCGSTLILFKKMKSASINIRSCTVDFRTLTLCYQAGGGITLLSDAKDEFNEMTYKHDSFIQTLTL
jgi:para-aminobenzoate synthetase component 1